LKQEKAGMTGMTGDIRFTASEDLGGGLKAVASTQFDVRGRNSSITPEDASITLMGGFGSITLGAVESGNGIIGRGFAGAPVSLATGYDGQILSAATNVDLFQYVSPSFSGATVKFQYVDTTGATAATGLTAGAGEGSIQANVIGVDYAAGPISAGVDMTQYKGTVGSAMGDRTRVSASYNLGVATVGFGYQKSTGSGEQNAAGVSIPLGALTVGAIYAKNADSGSGWGVGAQYNLSKRTFLNTSYGAIDDDAMASDTTEKNQYRIMLRHNF
jgi:hypothetical protein